MKNPVIILILILVSSRILNAQYLDLEWAKQQGGTNVTQGRNIAIDAAGYLYNVGEFTSTTDFDPGPAVFNLSPTGIRDIFISKFDLSGNFLWAKRLGGSSDCFTKDIITGAAGDIYISGGFTGNIDLDPGPGVYNLTSFGSNDIFLVKLNSSGNFIWGKQIGGPGDMGNFPCFQLGPGGEVYLADNFRGVIDVDPGIGITNLTSSGGYDIFIVKLDPLGNFIWAKQIGGTQNEWVNCICFDNSGSFYLAGVFSGIVDFDPGLNVYTQTSAGTTDGFIVKFDNSDNFLWAKQVGGTNQTGVASVKVDNAGNIFITGEFRGTADFDTGPGVYNLTTFGSSDIFVCRLISTGDLLWAGQIGGTGLDFAYINFDNSGSLYVVGVIENIADVDPGPGTYNLITSSGWDIFIDKLDMSGNLITVKQLKGIGDDFISGSGCFDNTGNFYLTGNFINTVDFNPCINATFLTTSGQVDAFLAKFKFKIASVSISSSSTTVCPGRPVTFTATPFNEGPTPFFQWQVNGINVGTNSPSYTTSTLVNGDIVSVTMSSPCLIYAPLRSNSIIMTDNPAIPGAVINADNTIICSGTPVNFSAVPTNGGITPSYQWQVNGTNVGTNSPVFTSSSLSNGDMVRVLITSSDPCAAPGAFPSNTLAITVNPKATPSVFVSSDNINICQGATVTFMAIPTNGGPTPVYQWQVNNVNVGISDPVYTTNTLNNGDNVKVLMTSSADCVLPGAFSSNTISITVNPKLSPSVRIASFPGNICYGTMVTIQATPVHGGNSPSYLWKLNGSTVETNRSSFVSSSLVDGDIIDCIMTSNYYCLSKTADTSNKIVIKIDPAVCPIGFYMPTGFTPNNDGKNDLCKPLLFGKVVSYRFSLYNKWGQKIFETTDVQKGWDGKISGFNQDTNIFIWMCSYQFLNQPAEFKKGTVLLIR